MPYYEVKDFAAGMDLRKSAVTAPAGTLRLLQNGHVTAGGEIEKRTQFQLFDTLPDTTTWGLLATKGLVWTAVKGAANTAPTPTTVGRLGIPTAKTIQEVLDWDLYDERFYVVILCTDGTVEHYFQAVGGLMVAVPTGKGRYVRTYKSKMHGVDGKTLYFSAVNDPNNWASGTGSGFINLATEDADMESLQGLEVYYDYLAIMSREATQLWYIDPDPSKNQYQQTLRQAGTVAPRSLRQYGSGDVLFLGADGIRSLKARAQSVSAAVSDIGSPLDPMIRQLFETQTEAFMSKAIASLQPYTGRYWMIFPDRILVLSNYPDPKISAWSVYYPEFTIEAATDAGGAIYLRALDGKVYRYGGLGVPVYDTAQVSIELPFLNFEKPATFKTFVALDAVATGEWDVFAAFNPLNPTAEDFVGKVTGPTFLDGQYALMGHSTHCSLRFRTTKPGQQTLASLMIHYQQAETT